MGDENIGDVFDFSMAALTLIESEIYGDSALSEQIKQIYSEKEISEGHFALNVLFLELLHHLMEIADPTITPEQIIKDMRKILIHSSGR